MVVLEGGLGRIVQKDLVAALAAGVVAVDEEETPLGVAVVVELGFAGVEYLVRC